MYLGDWVGAILKPLPHRLITLLIWCIIFPIPAVSKNCSVDQIDLRGSFGQVRFDVYLAATSKSREKGLMYITDFSQRKAMLFVYPEPQRVSFWMKNTLIPLDILFADGKGEIVRIHHNAKPHDKTLIYGGDNVQFVLEINAGLSKRFEFHIGAQMLHPMISDNANSECK
tara:strand:- start:275 stop:784 length:510 start_codon:yes stop_codon:yes gene_type:complete